MEEICKADLLVYPHKEVNAELFCVSVAEAQYAGAYPVTSDYGALPTTNMGTVIDGDPEEFGWRKHCVDSVVELLSDRKGLLDKQNRLVKNAYDRFHPDVIMNKWDELFTK